MRILAIINNKGGVGKTTTVQNLGAALQVFAKQKVLQIDFDAQANLTISWGCKPLELKHHVGTFLSGKSSFDEAVIRLNEVDLLPAHPDLQEYGDALKGEPTFPHNLALALEERMPTDYDYVLIDCPPELSTFTRIALVACQQYYVPLQPEYLSYMGLINLLNFTQQIQRISKAKLGGVFATRFNPRKNISSELIESTRKQLGDRFIESFIRENIALSEAQAMGTHIFEHAPKSNGAEDYYELAKKIIERSQEI